MKCNYILLFVKELVFIGKLYDTAFHSLSVKKSFNNSTLILIFLFQIQNNAEKTAVDTQVLHYTFQKMTNTVNDFFL